MESGPIAVAAATHNCAADEIIVVSNRDPTFTRARRRASSSSGPPAAGDAIEPVMRACSGTWVAHGSGSADAQTVDAHDRVLAPRGAANTRCDASG